MMEWITSYVGSTFGLVSVVGLGVVALAGLAFFTRKWQAAVAAVVLLALGFAYMHIDKQAYQRAIAEQHAKELDTLKGRMATLQKQTAADAERAAIDAKYIETLEAQAASETPPNVTPSIPADVAKRIGAIR